MTRREKVILTVTACCALAAGVHYALSSIGAEVKEKASQRAEDMAALLPVLQAQLAQSDLQASELAILERISGPWGEDPFSVGSTGEVSRSKSSMGNSLSYVGYLAIGRNRICIINDREYDAGMWLEDEVHRIQTVTADQVTLFRPDSAVEVILKLENEE